MIFGLRYDQILFWFLIYSFLGWVLEVIFHAVTKGRIVNRGFLNGPVCPVYGFGAVAILVGAQLIDTSGIASVNPVIVFAAGTVLATLIELIAGWMLDRLFHARWWDYSQEPFNFHGYICLRFSLLWGLGTLVIARVLQPMVAHVSDSAMLNRFGWWMLGILYLVYFVDFVITTSVLVGINHKLQQINEIRERMRVVSDSMSSGIGGSALATTQVIQQGRIHAQLARATVSDALAERADAAQDALYARKAALEKQGNELKNSLIARSHSMMRRILTASPDLIHEDYPELIEELRQEIKKFSKKESN